MEILEQQQNVVKSVGDSIMEMTSPVMGFNNRLGTLYVRYEVKQISFRKE